jgi:hypothetical protein
VKPSPRVRQLAAVLVVVFVLTTVWAAYYLYAETHASGARSSGTSVATYSESSTGGFSASVQPSYLYNNSSEIDGGDVNLFAPITNWINASISYTLETNRTASISLVESFAVTLSTPTWSKTLFTALNNSSSAATTVSTLTVQYPTNVSAVVALADAIDSQLDYYGSGYTLSLNPTISGTIEVAGVEEFLTSEPTLNFTFAGSLITPSGLVYASTGSLVSLAHPAAAGGLAGTVPYLAVAGSVGGLGGSAWIASRREDEGKLPPLDEIIGPFEEAIALIATAPKGETPISVATFADLVRIADTLGKPILRPSGPDPLGRTFFVFDGFFAYTYQYPGDAGKPFSLEGRADSPFDPGHPPTAASLVERLQAEVGRLQSISLDEPTAAKARQLVSRALDLLRAGAVEDAAVEVDALVQLLGPAVDSLDQPS